MEEALSSKKILVIHPRFYLYGGGELLCLETCKALQEAGHEVFLACDTYDPNMVEKMYGLGSIMEKCHRVILPRFQRILPRFMAAQRVRYAGRIRRFFNYLDPDLVFSTQSSIYFLPGKPTFHFIYDVEDLQLIQSATLARFDSRVPFWKLPYYEVLRKYRDIVEQPSPLRHFMALSSSICDDLTSRKYPNCELVVPPCPAKYHPRPKKNQVVQVTRVVPQKKLEDFLSIARRLPMYEFAIVGRESVIHPGYLQNLLNSKPDNLTYYEAPIVTVPELLEESKVYLYTSHEPGIGIALVQGIGAGCFPVVPTKGGGAEVAQMTGVGYEYGSIDEAVNMIRMAMETEISPESISRRAKQFSPERFRQRIQSFC